MQCLHVVLHGTLRSYLRDALHEDGAADVACAFLLRRLRLLHILCLLFSFLYTSLHMESITCNQISIYALRICTFDDSTEPSRQRS
jgi:hypothetical protein